MAKLIETKECFDLCDIWRLRNPDARQFTFRRKHVSGFIQHRLDSICVSNNLHKVITRTDFLAALSVDHSPIIILLSKKQKSHPWLRVLKIQQFFIKKNYSNLLE